MKPDYESSGVQLYRGDCVEVMTTLVDGSVDAVIADPPYGYNQAVWDNDKPPIVIWDSFWRVLCNGGVLYYWGFWQDAPWVLGNAQRVGLSPMSRLIWWYRTGMPQAKNYRQDAETFWYMAKGDPSVFNADIALEPYEDEANYKRYGRDGKHPGTVWKSSRIFHNHPENCGHPTQKPVGIIKKSIEVSTNPGATVLDPFMGSGTTGVACVNTGRKFIGIEIEQEYFDIAVRRIEEAQQQASLL